MICGRYRIHELRTIYSNLLIISNELFCSLVFFKPWPILNLWPLYTVLPHHVQGYIIVILLKTSKYCNFHLQFKNLYTVCEDIYVGE